MRSGACVRPASGPALDLTKRVAVARALITEPEIVLLDEPTSALEISVQAEVLNLLTRLQRERELIYILDSHNLAVVAHMCEGLAVMQQAKRWRP